MMTSKEEILENVTEDQVKDNMEVGIIMAIDEKKNLLNEQIKDLSKKELTRLIRNAANFPQQVSVNGARELAATQTLYAIKDLQVEMSILSIGKMQEEQDGNNSEGEQNE